MQHVSSNKIENLRLRYLCLVSFMFLLSSEIDFFMNVVSYVSILLHKEYKHDYDKSYTRIKNV